MPAKGKKANNDYEEISETLSRLKMELDELEKNAQILHTKIKKAIDDKKAKNILQNINK